MITSGHVRFHPSLEPLFESVEMVRPHPDNPSSGDEDAITESIEINGMYRPVYVQRSTGYILAGNTTYAACLRLGSLRIPVVWLDVDDTTALRILLGDNELARLAIVDLGLLAPQIDLLLQTELRLLGTGYVEPPPVPEPTPIEPGYTVSVHLTGDEMATWFDVPGDNDRQRLAYLFELR